MKTILALAALMAGTPLAAQTLVSTSNQPTAISASTPVATEVAAKLFPAGTYRQMLGETFTKMTTGMLDQIGDLPLGEIAKAFGFDEKNRPQLDKATLSKVMAIIDPAFKDRTRLIIDGMFKGMIPVMETMEPELRAGLAESLSTRFTPAQLTELKAFFETPTGSSFAAQQMLLFVDPAVMGRMQAQMPTLMQAMPKLVGDAMKAANSLPKARKYADLTKDEREELAKLLGVDPKSVTK
ncbi:MAG: hypothetical protein ACKVOJ_09805 [Sphingomonadaceae bacterium]